MSTVNDSIKFSELDELPISQMEFGDYIAILDSSANTLKKVLFDGSVSNGLKSGTTLGDYATAEGHDNIASGYCAHVEGFNNSAVGKCSHAEGEGTYAQGNYSHTQGYGTIASSIYSSASGQNTRTANNNAAQTVVGRYNIGEDPANAFEIGNGTSSERSNAFTVTWTGDVWSSGQIVDGSGNVLSQKFDAKSIGVNIPGLDEETGKIFENQFNSSLEGYYDISTNKFYKRYEGNMFHEEIPGMVGKLYVDKFTNEVYRYQDPNFIKVSVIYPVFNEASRRDNIVSGESLSTLFSKIKKVIADLGTAAYKNTGSPDGVAELDSNGKVPSAQLPSFVDDIVEGYRNPEDGEFYKESTFTTRIPGETGKIYVDFISNNTYRWSGSIFVEISESLALGETASTAYRGDRGKEAYDFTIAPFLPINPPEAPLKEGSIWIEDL